MKDKINFNWERARLLKEISIKPRTSTQLQKDLKMNKSLLDRYLKELLNNKLIKRDFATDKRGKRVPIRYSITNKSIPLAKIYFKIYDLFKK